jgi:sulfite reductase (NADPH) hemoprotein beta-component
VAVARLFEDAEIDQGLASVTTPAVALEVVDLQAAPAVGAAGAAVPASRREFIRSLGPSVRTDLGKQAGLDDGVREGAVGPHPSYPHAPFAGIYQYDQLDRQFLRDRAEAFRHQMARRLEGALSEEEFKPLRLMNGLYLQLHAYMLRVAIPYGVLSAAQMRCLAHVARVYDRGYGHFTTRQNIQFNWLRLVDAPDVLAVLAEADLHGIQTSGNCIRNTTTDQFAGAAADEVVDPRVFAEILRQWSTDHPEFTYLPRKFKIAITGSALDRAAIRVHDIGIMARRNEAGEIGFEIHAGGGLGRTPLIAKKCRDFVPVRELLRYVEAILRTYNALGRRDNIYKARIKILVRDMKPSAFLEMVEAEYAAMPAEYCVLDEKIVEAIAQRFATPPFAELPVESAVLQAALRTDPALGAYLASNTHPHRVAGYVSAVISLKPPGGIPGDASAAEMELCADLADRFSFGELRVTHEQNLVLPHVRLDDLPALHTALVAGGLGSANIGQLTDIIACPGLDYCALATARSIPLAQELGRRFADPALQREIGPLTLNISGCINACGHHHVGHIGLLGVDKAGEEVYQITLGGAADEHAAIGSLLGPAVPADAVVDTIETIIGVYRGHRTEGERFIDTYRRLGAAPFKEAVYAAH